MYIYNNKYVKPCKAILFLSFYRLNAAYKKDISCGHIALIHKEVNLHVPDTLTKIKQYKVVFCNMQLTEKAVILKTI